MKNRKMAVLGLVLSIGMVAVGCGNTQTESSAPESAAPSESATASVAESTAAPESAAESQASTDAVSGKITMEGSTSMEKLANASIEVFSEKYPDITVSVEFTGSGAGIEAVTAGNVDIGNSSRALKEEEKAAGIVENIVAIDGIAVITDTANSVTDISKDQLAGIYKGEITNWNEVGGEDSPIVVIGREAASGTRGGFEELVEVKDACKYANELDSTGAVIAKVSSTPGAIGYASLDAVNDTVKTLSLDGVEATVEEIRNGNYFLSRPFVMATKGEIAGQSEAVKTYFDFLKSEEGKQVISDVGLVLPE